MELNIFDIDDTIAPHGTSRLYPSMARILKESSGKTVFITARTEEKFPGTIRFLHDIVEYPIIYLYQKDLVIQKDYIKFKIDRMSLYDFSKYSKVKIYEDNFLILNAIIENFQKYKNMFVYLCFRGETILIKNKVELDMYYDILNKYTGI